MYSTTIVLLAAVACFQIAMAAKPAVIQVIPKSAPVIQKKQESTFKQLAPVLAASFCAAAIMYPLDLVRALQMANAGSKETTLQLLSNFKKTHGVQGFFTQGLAPELARATWMRSVKFGLFPIIHLGITGGIPEAKGNAVSKIFSAILTSIPEVISIMPLEIAKLTLQLDSKKVFGNSMGKAMQSVYKERGPSGFFIGYFGVQCRNAAWGAGYFASIKFFERQIDVGLRKIGIDSEKSASAKTLVQLTSGFCAGVFGSALNTPCDTIRSVVQKRILGGLPGASTFLGVGREIVAARGPAALYAGFSSKAVHLGGGGALMAFFIPFFKKAFAKLE